MKKQRIYLDCGATTPVDPRILKKVMPFFTEEFGNPSSSHFIGEEAKIAVAKAREQIAQFLNCKSSEIIFTSGGTESENLAIKGIAFSSKKFGNHIITSEIEHLSVSASADFLTKQGFEITRISVDDKCNINLKELESAIKDETVLVSIMMSNNEIGTIQPITEIYKIINKKNKERITKGKKPIRLHTDGEAGSFYLDVDVKKLGVDSISINGSKLYSLKGASALFIKEGTSLATQILGGGQERLLRGGTENVPAIVSLGKAVYFAKNEKEKNIKKVLEIKKYLIKKITKEIPDTRLNTPENSLPNLAHFTFLNNPQNIDIVSELSKKGIAVSRGSACSAIKTFTPSATLTAMGFSNKEAYSSLRISLGKYNTKKDIDELVKNIKFILK